MDDPVFKQKYQKYKLRVKVWEKDFKKKHGRVPSKYDIREASQEIRDSYKMYYKLKTSFLEDTLNEVLSEDGFDVFEMTQTDEGIAPLDDSLVESVNGAPQLPIDISAIMNSTPTVEPADSGVSFSNLHELPTPNAHINLINRDENHVIKQFEAVEQLAQNEKAWGKNVSKKLPEADDGQEGKLSKRCTFRASLNPNNFGASSGFSKRNPRKPLSRTSQKQSLSASSSNFTAPDGSVHEFLPDLETILIRKAKEHQAAAAIAANPLLASASVERSKDTLKSQVDAGWLERTSAQNGLKRPQAVATCTEQSSTATPVRKTHFGLTNIDVSKLVKVAATAPTVMPDRATGSAATPTIAPVPAPSYTPNHVIQQKPKAESDSDSVVADSEDEQDAQEVRHRVKRRRLLSAIVEVPGPQIVSSQADELAHRVTAEANVNISQSEDCRDFSPDEEYQDATYEPEESKSKRKKAVAKRKVAKAENKPKATPKAKAKAEPKTRVDKPKAKATATREKKPRAAKTASKASTRSKKQQTTAAATVEEEPQPEEPLNPEELRYTLALERGDLTSVPRIKMAELEQADTMAQRYINNLAVRTSSSTMTNARPLVNEKRAEARRKLEEKIATGKLNENFVTINIEKKKFVRGKKGINYSKYKKQQWKHKKHIAALSGPDMDMGGCDGGVLTCFQCGGVGHMARECKIKGDTLLPLTAQIAEDPSPFPTLEEAEHMAAQSAVAVHSRNITRLPQASNAAIYQRLQLTENSDGNEVHHRDSVEQADVAGQSTVGKDTRLGGDNDVDKDELSNESDEYEFQDSDFAELDAAVAASELSVSHKSPIKSYVGHKIPESFLKSAGLDSSSVSGSGSASKFAGVSPLYSVLPDGSVPEPTPEVLEALHLFGHTNFRKGQDRAVMRILCGLSTLVTLSTGSGKSLCYQLPAYLYSRQKKSITLVISPLVSLMEDQVTGVPDFLRAHCLHTNQTPQQRLKIQQMIADGEIDVLLVSPEAVVSGERSTGFGAILRQLPPIAFACIDEAHCVSQWSHNFRPSYLMICKVLRQNLGVHTVLGLTATATLPTRMSIINHLGLTDGERGIISDIPLPDNLILSISKDENRDSALLALLNSPRFEACQSVIIYCTRREECERIATFLRTCMQDRRRPDELAVSSNKRKRVSWQAEPYHAGMAASRRRTIQNAFMKNELRTVVATVAFGMGINKPDIRSVIHYNMPRNFESYVQEIGRAGRDGKVSHCHLFLAPNDQNELRRHIFANSIDRHVIRKLLQRIFVPCACGTPTEAGAARPQRGQTLEVDASDFGEAGEAKAREHNCPGHEIGFSVAQTVAALDIPAENISTLLCYMELDSRWCMNVLSAAYVNAKVISYGGAKYLKHAAKECPPLAMAIALQIKNKTFKEDDNIIEFSVVDIAAAIGWNSGVVKYQLKNLEWVQINGFSKRSPITVSFNDLGFRLKAPGDFTVEEIDDALDTLYTRSVKQEHTQLIQLQYVFQGLSAVAYNTYVPCMSSSFSGDRSEQLKGIIRNYFCNDYPKDLHLEVEESHVPDDYVINDTHALINMYPDNSFSGRNVARIFHGIQSPNFPAVIWGRCKFWRAHTKTNFNRIVQLANAEIVKRRM